LGALAQRVLDLKTEDPRHYVDFISTARRKFDVFEEGGPLWEKGRGAVRRHREIKDGNRPVVVCIVCAQRYMRDLAPYYALQLGAFMQEATRPGGRKTAMVIDEAPRFPLQAIIEDQTVLRGYGASMLFVAQSAADIEKRFGDKSARILDDVCSLHQIMGVASFAEAKRISDALGRETYVVPSMNTSGEKPDVGFGLSDPGRPLMTPEEVMAMPKDEQIIFVQGLPPIRAKKIYQNQIAPICHALDPNPMEGGKLAPDPIIEIHYDRVKP
jgi:type IV secretion system protein VirD4